MLLKAHLSVWVSLPERFRLRQHGAHFLVHPPRRVPVSQRLALGLIQLLHIHMSRSALRLQTLVSARVLHALSSKSLGLWRHPSHNSALEHCLVAHTGEVRSTLYS